MWNFLIQDLHLVPVCISYDGNHHIASTYLPTYLPAFLSISLSMYIEEKLWRLNKWYTDIIPWIFVSVHYDGNDVFLYP